MRDTGAEKGIPRIFDVTASAAALLALSPVLLAAAVLVKITSKGPALFVQERVGLGGKPFFLYKFRTMTAGNAGPLVTSGGDPRVTAIGRVLRRTKVDELPQLWNVFKGDMSITGPRPEVRAYVEMDPEAWKVVLSVRPGLTDPVTLRLRNEEELLAAAEDPQVFYEKHLAGYKLKGYSDYVREKSVLGDLKLIVSTAICVIIPGLSPVPTAEEVRQGWKSGKKS